jgi:putative DNA methylase
MIHPGQSLFQIVHSWKSYTAHRIRKLTGVTGRIWQPEYWDRFIRDDEHFVAAAEYIENNPVLAGLVDSPELWVWSSAGEGGRAARAPGA